jgi:alpha-tubulin suppressor-like RCC1 family protein
MRSREIFPIFGICLALLISFGCGTASNPPEENTVAAPALTPVAGTYSAALDIVMATTTANATIRYTTDGTTPTPTSGTVYAAPVHVAETTTFEAVAYRSGWTTSPVTTAAYTIAPLVAAPTFSPAAGIYLTAQDVTISTATAGASIRYTTDGTTPTDTIGTLYAGPVHAATPLTLKAVGYRTGWTTSLVTSGRYEIGPLAAAPAFAPVPGTYLDPQDVAITTTTPGASIRYTIDGTTPTDTTGTLYSGPVHLADSVTLRAVAFGFGIRTSAVTSGSYTIGLHVAGPEFSPPPGTYSSAQDIAITTSTAGASIRYTADGTTPTDTIGTLYTAPVHAVEPLTLKAVAFKAGWTTSAVISGDYKIGLIVADPVFSVPPGTYATAKNVAITTATAAASIRYTTDGSAPTTTHGTIYTGPVRIARSLTLKAVAYRTGYTTSSVTTGEYKRVGVSAGVFHAVLAKPDGTVWAWGGNTEGQLGDGTTTPGTTPTPIPGLSDVVDVAAGYYHTLALKSDGTVWAWGRNLFGQLGDGTSTEQLAPVRTVGLSGVTAIACGGNSTYALKSDGTVWAWGNNAYGQLGDGTQTDQHTPVQLPGLIGITAIAAGEIHGLALAADGTVWAWGNNSYGQLGDGTTTTQLSPVQVPSLTGMTGLGADGYHSSAVKSDGTLWSWGAGPFGELGIGDRPPVWPTPTQALGLAAVVAVGAGGYHTVALIGDGTLQAFGNNVYGQLGIGTNTDSPVAVPVPGISLVIDVGAGLDFTVAVRSDATVWAWGHNYSYQLGDGTTTDRWTPVRIIP